LLTFYIVTIPAFASETATTAIMDRTGDVHAVQDVKDEVLSHVEDTGNDYARNINAK